MPDAKPDLTLDVKGLTCPMPVLKAKKAIATVPIGGTLEILATDAGALADFRAFCEATRHTLVSHAEEAGGVFRLLVRRES